MGFAMVAGGKPDMAAPVTGILLSSIVEGSIVKLNENGSPVEFYVAKHNYESALNGNGRTLLLRKDVHSNQVWDAGNVSAYAISDIDTWLNEDYKSLFNDVTKAAIGTTKFYYSPGNGDHSVGTLERSVFILSFYEHGFSINPVLGSPLPNYMNYSTSYCNGVPSSQLTRTPGNEASAMYLFTNSSGIVSSGSVFVNASNGARPCFTLPSTALFDPDTLILKGVA